SVIVVTQHAPDRNRWNPGYLSRGLKTRTVSLIEHQYEYARSRLKRFEVRVYGVLTPIKRAVGRSPSLRMRAHLRERTAAPASRIPSGRQLRRPNQPNGARKRAGVDRNYTLRCAKCPPNESILRPVAVSCPAGGRDRKAAEWPRSRQPVAVVRNELATAEEPAGMDEQGRADRIAAERRRLELRGGRPRSRSVRPNSASTTRGALARERRRRPRARPRQARSWSILALCSAPAATRFRGASG